MRGHLLGWSRREPRRARRADEHLCARRGAERTTQARQILMLMAAQAVAEAVALRAAVQVLLLVAVAHRT